MKIESATIKLNLALFLTALPALLLPAAETFDSELFPGLENHSENSVRLHGLAALYPSRVLFEAPQLDPTDTRTEAASLETLPLGIKYIRIYHLEAALPLIREHAAHPALLLDFRYVRSASSASALGALLRNTEDLPQLKLIGTVPDSLRQNWVPAAPLTPPRQHPAIVLSNRETAGPFEAVLAALQATGAVLIVGENTSGKTGFYSRTESGEAWVLEGELHPAATPSLVGSGLTPRIPVAIGPEANYRGYHLYEAGTRIDWLIGRTSADQPVEPTSEELAPSPGQPLTDPVLQKGVEIVGALQILRQLPDS